MDPLHQFLIHTLIPLRVAGWDISITNASVFMVLSAVLPLMFLKMGLGSGRRLPGLRQAMAEQLYTFGVGLVEETNGEKGRPYRPFILAIFLFILTGNALGMLPYAFTFTSHIIATFALAAFVFLIITGIAIATHGRGFLRLFWPEGVPLFMAPLLIPVEILSYLSRPISLAVRLFANMMAGHAMLKVFAGFTVLMGVWGAGPLVVNIALTGFEMLVAVLQAYVFSVLACLYLHDALHLH